MDYRRKLRETLTQNDESASFMERLQRKVDSSYSDLADSFSERYSKYAQEAANSSNDYNTVMSSNRHNDWQWEQLQRDADNLRNYYLENKKSMSEDSYKSMMDYLDSFDNTSREVRKYYKNNYDYYSQFETEDDYNKYKIGWLSNNSDSNTPENVKARNEYYTNNVAKIADLNAKISNTFGSDRKELEKQKEALETENRQYERTQKVSDDYFNVTQNSDFESDSQKRDYKNPTKEDFETYDARISNGITYDADGVGRDVFGDVFDDTYNDRFKEPQVIDRLGLFLGATKRDIEEAYAGSRPGMENVWESVIKDGVDGDWDKLDKQEISIYYYLLENDGQEKADKYLNDMKVELNRRATQERTEAINEADALEKLALNVASIPASVLGGAIGFADDTMNSILGNERNPYNAAHSISNFAQDVRSSTANDINDATGNVSLPFVGTTFGDAYQALMSGADSLVGAGLLGRGYTAIMGMSAASSEARKLYEQGASDTQIAIGALTSGVAEAAFEYISLDKFLSTTSTKSWKELGKQILAQAGVEASEEMFTEIANTITNAIVMRSQSEWQKLYDEGGFKEAFLGTLSEVLNAGIGGFISGGAMAGIGSGINLASYNNQMKSYGNDLYKNKGINTYVDYAKNNEIGKNSKKLLGNVEGFVDNSTDNNNLTNKDYKNIGKFADSIESDLYEKATKAEISERLLKENLTNDEKTINSVYKYITNNADIKLASNEVKAIAEQMINSEDFAPSVAMRTITSRFNMVQENNNRVAEDTDKITDVNNNISENTTSVNDTVDVEENTSVIESGTEALKKAIKSVEGTSNIDSDTMNIIEAQYDGVSPAEPFVKGMIEGYNYGLAGVDKADIPTNGLYSQLSDSLKAHSYMLGENASNAKADSIYSNIVKGKNKKIGRRRGIVKGEGVKISDLKKTFNDTQNKAYKMLSTIAEVTGFDIVLFKSETDADGNFVGEQGKFSRKNNTIYIDINAGLKNEMDVADLGKYAMLRTFSHEFCHTMERWSPKEYVVFRKLVFETLSKRGENVNDLIEEKMAITPDLSYDDASREVLAEAMTDILPDSNFIKEIADKNKNVFEKLREKLQEFINELKAYFNSIGSNRSREANALKEEINGELHYLENISKAFDNIALQTVDNFQSNFAVDEVTEETKANEDNKPIEPKTTTSDNGYTITDNIKLNSIEIKFNEKPSEAIRNVLKENKFRWNGKKGIWYGRTTHETISKALDNVYNEEKESSANEEKSDFMKSWEKASQEEKDEVINAINENTKISHMYPTEIREDNTSYESEYQEVEQNETNGGQERSSETIRKDNNGAVLQSESDGEGTARLLDERKEGDVQRVSGRREAMESTSERGEQTERDSNREHAGSGISRSEGTSESGDLRRDGILTEEETKAKEEKLQEVVSEEIEQKSKENPKGNNFVIGESLNLPSGEKARVRANIDAIKLVNKLESEGRYATAKEQEVLSKYVGWGGLPNTFGELTYNRETKKSEMTPKKGWENEFAELKQLVTDGIITEQEYKDMSASTKNAHYTSVEVIKAMYDGLAQLGFKGGRMLEPSSGVGNFVGCMPTNLTSQVKSWTMVELDSITGKIAKYLYPNADVRIQGFERANIPDNFMDVAIGNVPFGNYGVVDRAYPKRITKAIHNYFFAKTLDKVRPGGLVMFITSSFTMNGEDTTVRQYIMDRADLLGAIRLPNTAFSGNAGTQVVTDILILKKRIPGTQYAGEAFLESNYKQIEGWQGGYINEYFDNHPEMALGTPVLARGMYGANSLTYNPLEGKGTLGEQIREAFKNITTKMDYTVQATPEQVNNSVAKANKKTKQSGLVVNSDGSISQNQNGKLVKYNADASTAKRIAGLLGIRDAYRKLADSLMQGLDEDTVKEARKELNTVYDKFVKENGYINSPKNRSAIADDPDSFSIYSLENYNATTKTATKADIFTKNTIGANKTVTHVDNVEEALIVSINKTGGVDAGLIAKLTGKKEETVIRELIDSRMAFKTRDGLEAPETYLSGNVRAKLREAEGLAPIDKDYQNNVEELKKVIPKDIPYNEIYVALGTPWIPTNVYADFIAETLGGVNRENSYSGPDVSVGRSNQTGEFKIVINNGRLKSRYQNTQQWGTGRRTFIDLVTAMMSSTSITVNDYIEDDNGRKKAVINKVETAAAQAKAEEITKEFQEWIWRDENRRNELASLYNETYNALVTPKYNGSNLTINGLNAEFSLREHQANAVQRIIASGGNTLLAHKVGAGKTLEMASAAMKLRELGIVKKPIFVVPKSLVAQWGNEFKSYFPASKLLVSDEKSFTKANRKTFTNKIANGDYDAVIVSYEQFEKVPMSAEFRQEFYQQQIDEILAAIAEEKAETNGKGLTVKQMEKKVAQLQKKIQELTTKEKDEDNINFEQLGIDSLFVDEAHNFKNLQYVTNMRNISGLGNTDGSQRAFDLYTKVRYLQKLNGGRGIVFATATPVMNSMAEMYIMQKYLQSDMLNQLGLTTFDAWAKQFGEVVNSVEIKPSGQGFRVKQTFSNFRNLNELQMLFRSFSDVLTQVPGLKIPKMKGGKVNTVVCEPGQFQKDYMAELEKRADNIKNVDPSEDNMLKITSDGRKVSYTQRMIDPTLPYEPGCKIYRCCDNVIAEYKASKSNKGTQIIFCDMATPKGKSKTSNTNTDNDIEFDTDSAKLYDDMRAYLVKKGIPAKEIAFIHEANTDAKKKQLFADMNEGKVRVLIGSTGKMGVGMNAQKRIVAIHHLDAPWRPGDVEQRDGRAFRQKNMNDEVSKYTYVTEGSFDARLWDILDRKQHFIEQIMNGDDVGRSAEDTGDVTLSAAEVKALASGNPLIMEQVQLTDELSKLDSLKKAYNSDLIRAKTKYDEDGKRIAALTTSIEEAKADVKSRINTYTEGNFSITIGKDTFTDKKDAGIALMTDITAKANNEKFVTVGKFAGFELKVIKEGAEYKGLIVGKHRYKFNVYTNNTTYMINHLCAIVEGLEGTIEKWNDVLSELKTDIKAQEEIMSKPFAQEEELNQKRSRFNEIMAILNPPEEQNIGDSDEDSKEQKQSRGYLNSNDDISYQQRTNTLTDREVLELAANEINISDLTAGEKQALDIFNNRLGKLQDLQNKRLEQGKLYKEQQFGTNVDRAAANETLNRMHVLDKQIKTASLELLSVEEKEVLSRVLKKSRTIIERNEKQNSKEMLDRWRERRRDADSIKKYRNKIKADVDELSKWIIHPDNKDALKRVPDFIKNSVIQILTSVDFTSKRQLKGGEATIADKAFINQLNALKSAIKTNIDVNGMYSGYNDLPPDFMDDLQNFIDKTQMIANNITGNYVINQMTAEELKTLSKLIRTLKKWITQVNRFHSNAMYDHVNEAAESTMKELRSMDNAGDKVGDISNFVFWQQIRPAYGFERFGEGGKAIYDEFRRAQATLALNSNQIIDFTAKTYTEDEVKQWEKEYKEFNLGGDLVRIPISYMMSFYELSKQPDSLRHMLGEGIRVATYKDGKSKISDNGHTLTQGDINTIIGELTQRQIEVADALQKYMSTVGAKWGNYVSVARFGEELFTNPQYFPINSDGRHLESTAEEHPSNASLYALLNMGFTKQRNEEANNRIVLYSIFDVFANHMASMAQYNAFALPVLDSLKWFNYKDIELIEHNENGKTSIEKVNHGSIREELSRVYGVPEESRPGSGREGYAETFIKNIIRAYNGTETQGIPTDTQGIKLLRRYNMAQIAYNLRVVVQQPMTITRAAMFISYPSIINGVKTLATSPSKLKATIEEMNKYSGIAAWKSLGFYDINISRGLTDMIKHESSTLDKIGEIGMMGAEKADEITWAAMWNACKLEIAKNNNIPKDSENYYDAVTKLFEDVIYKTQVVDSVLTKNEFMRSKGYFARAISSFMSEPVTTASMVIGAYDKYKMSIKKGMSKQQAWQENKKYIYRTCAVYGVSAILLAAVQAVIDGFRDDDDEEYTKKWLEAFNGNVIDELLPFNKLPIMSDFYDIAKQLVSIFGVDTYGNPPQTIIAQWYDSLIKGTQIVFEKASGEKTNYTYYGGVKKLLQAVSGMSGLPIAASTREVVTIWNSTFGTINKDLKVVSYMSDTDKLDKVNKAIESEDYGDIEEAIEEWKKYRDKKGDDSKKARQNIQSRLTSYWKPLFLEAYQNNDYDEMARIRKALNATGIYEDVVKTTQNWIKNLNK